LLRTKLAVVTGASGGIGFEVSRQLLQRGATILVTSRELDRARETAKKLGPGAIAEQVDITDQKSTHDFARRIAKKYHRLDLLVNNAGYPFDRRLWYKKFHEGGDDALDSVLAVDLAGTVRISRACIPLMMKRGGVIISISSTPAIAGHSEGAPYTLAKSAIIAMTKHIALEYGRNKIRAYVLALGNIATEATFNAMTGAERKKAANENAMKRWGRPAEVATAVAALASEDFSFATGNTIVIDGGTVLH
jgi:3-oxoacyl-[acyl-carrier protein] reductase